MVVKVVRLLGVIVLACPLILAAVVVVMVDVMVVVPSFNTADDDGNG